MTGEFAAQIGLTLLAISAAFCQLAIQGSRLLCTLFLILIAFLTTGLAAILVSFNGASIYGLPRHAAVLGGIGLLWLATFTPGADSRTRRRLASLVIVTLLGCWLPSDGSGALALYGGWFLLAQIAAGVSVSIWLYAVVCGKPGFAVGAMLAQVTAVALLGLGALGRFGRAFGWDPLEAWWLFTMCSSLLTWLIVRKSNSARWLLAGLIPALFTWLASWPLMLVLQVITIYAQ